jgi:hypothetical protein
VSGELVGALAETLIAVYIIDRMTGQRKKVYVKDVETKRMLLAQNRELRKKLAKRKVVKRKTAKRKR